MKTLSSARGTIALGLTVGFGFCILTTAAYAAQPVLGKVAAQIETVENELLATDNKSIHLQTKKLKQLLTLQRQEIKLNQNKLKDLAKKIESLGQKKESLATLIQTSRVDLYKSLKLMAVTLENNQGAKPSLDALWMSSFSFDQAQTRMHEALAKMRATAFAKLVHEREELLVLETNMSREKEAMDFYVEELKEKENVLIANEKLQRGMLANKKSAAKDDLSRLAMLKDRRAAERGVEQALKADSIQVQASESALSALKGRLPFPVQGDIVSGYGRHYDKKNSLHTFQKGISIAAFGDTPVKAVAEGKVVFSGELRHYGRMVIVEHPGKFYTLYGRMGSAEVKEGDAVNMGAFVGRTTADGAPLYFEIRDRNIAINPAQWLNRVSVSLNR